MENKEWRYQLSLKYGEDMINVRANDLEEFKQRVQHAKEVMGGLHTKGEEKVPFADRLPDDSAPVLCQFCKGPTWDNRKNKLNPKGPDFKCKDKECGGAAWIDRKTNDLKWRK